MARTYLKFTDHRQRARGSEGGRLGAARAASFRTRRPFSSRRSRRACRTPKLSRNAIAEGIRRRLRNGGDGYGPKSW
jgi:hypothetical protein